MNFNKQIAANLNIILQLLYMHNEFLKQIILYFYEKNK